MEKQQIDELQKLPFEQALEKLEEIVGKMESGKLPLEEMMKTFEEGRHLSMICMEKLKSVEKKIEILKKKSDGTTEWALFPESASSAES